LEAAGEVTAGRGHDPMEPVAEDEADDEYEGACGKELLVANNLVKCGTHNFIL
jgi:hypothetical protein